MPPSPKEVPAVNHAVAPVGVMALHRILRPDDMLDE